VTASVAGFQPQNVTAYDPAGRPAILTAGSHTATYRYVANSRIRAGVTYRANGTQRLDTQYDFDRLNRLQQVLNQPSAAGQPAERHAYTYNAAQQRIRDELANGSSWNWEYDRLGQVIGGRKSWPDGSPVAGQQFEYGFDDIGNRVSQKRGGDANGANLRSTTYGVNPLNQITNRTVVGSRYLDLIGLAEPGTTVTAGGVIASRRGEFWRAELNLGNGNPLWQSVNITTSDGGSLANALYRVPPSSEVPTYDADGNLTADGLWTYTWDAENRLISMQSQALVPTAGRRKLDFEYDPLGRRIGRTVSTGAGGSWLPTSTTRWLYEGWNPVAELNSAGTLVREYVWGTDLSGNWQGAGGVGGLLWVLEAPTVANAAHYVAYDGNGNVMGLVNAADGTWSARYEYGPFGEVIRSTGSMAATNLFRWSTKIQDEDSGLNYYGYRYYSAAVGRWLGRDPIRERGGHNLFGFAFNNPTQSIDSDGRVVLQGIDQITQDWIDPYKPWYHPSNLDAVGASVGKAIFVVFSFGTICKNDRLADRNLAGEITDGQFWAGASVNTAVALSSVATGGAAANAVAGAGGNLVLQGAAGGFASSLTDVLGTRVGYAAGDISYEGTFVSDLVQVGAGTLIGTVFGGGAQVRQALTPGSGAAGQVTLGPVDCTLRTLQRTPQKQGYFDVIGHGNPRVIRSEQQHLDADGLAQLLSQLREYNCQNLRLLSCRCGQGLDPLGSQLARRTMVVVKAPNNLLWPDGTVQNGMLLPSGQWIRVPPKGDFRTFSPFNLYAPLNWRPDEKN
jgi:RHS repeat-associated protein